MTKSFGLLTAAGAIALIVNVGSASATTITFDGIADPGSFVNYGAGPLTLSGATFTGDGTIFVIDPAYYGSIYPNGGFLTIDFAGATDTLTVNLPGGVNSVSFDFGALFGGGPVAADVSLNGGVATLITAGDSISGSNALDHFSFSSASAISTVTFTLPDSPQYNAIDNFSFAGGVPEPSTWAMMILGFLGLGFMAYRRKASPALMAA